MSEHIWAIHYTENFKGTNHAHKWCECHALKEKGFLIYLSEILWCNYSSFVSEGLVFEIMLAGFKKFQNLNPIKVDSILSKSAHQYNGDHLILFYPTMHEALEVFEKIKDIYENSVKKAD